MRPALYRQLITEYSDKQLPSLKRITVELHVNSRYNILKDAARAAENFYQSATFAGVLDAKGYIRKTDIADNQAIEAETPTPQSDDGVRHSDRPLDTSSEKHESASEFGKLPGVTDNLDRLEIQLSNGKKAFLFVPVPLPQNEKTRLNAYIDLLLEEDPNSVPETNR